MPLVEVALDRASAAPAEVRSDAAVDELQECGFQIVPREPDVQYRVSVGDIGTDDPQAFGPQILWPDAHYFEGSRGAVRVALSSRDESDGDGAWRDRAVVIMRITSAKLSEARYEGMFEQLQRLAGCLVVDLVSKTLRGFRFTSSRVGISVSSSHVEIALLRKVWREVSLALHEIARQPVVRIERRTVPGRLWGSERLGPVTLRSLGQRSLDPRRRDTPRPFDSLRQLCCESHDTLEHRVILGFLRFLERRLIDCRQGVEAHIRALEGDRLLREAGGAEGNLFAVEDRPRLLRLEKMQAEAERLVALVRRAGALPLLRGLVPEYRLRSSPVFENVDSYRRILRAIVRFLDSSVVIVDTAAEERIKSTSRMYEQWVFLQLASAFRESGLRCVRREGMFRCSRPLRYTVAIERGASLEFEASGARRVRLRFEPWIRPLESARARGDTLYRGIRGESAWSPDIVIEFLSIPEDGDDEIVDYVVVLDAKYASRVVARHWQGTGKYLEIRATRDNRQVVRQLWLAYPSFEGQPIAPRDPAIHWTEQGPSCPLTETVQGELRLLPPASGRVSTSQLGLSNEDDLSPRAAAPAAARSGGRRRMGADSDEWIERPERPVLDFVRGQLRFLGLEPTASFGTGRG